VCVCAFVCLCVDDFPFIIVGATVGIALGLLVVAVVAVLVCKRLNVVRHKGCYTTSSHCMQTLRLFS